MERVQQETNQQALVEHVKTTSNSQDGTLGKSADLNSLSTQELNKLSASQLNKLNPTQLSKLKPNQIKKLNATQLSKLSPAKLKAKGPVILNKLSKNMEQSLGASEKQIDKVTLSDEKRNDVGVA